MRDRWKTRQPWKERGIWDICQQVEGIQGQRTGGIKLEQKPQPGGTTINGGLFKQEFITGKWHKNYTLWWENNNNWSQVLDRSSIFRPKAQSKVAQGWHTTSVIRTWHEAKAILAPKATWSETPEVSPTWKWDWLVLEPRAELRLQPCSGRASPGERRHKGWKSDNLGSKQDPNDSSKEKGDGVPEKHEYHTPWPISTVFWKQLHPTEK